MGQCPTLHLITGRFLPLCWCLLGLLVLTSGDDTGQGMKCSGYCTKDTFKCQLRGGKVVGQCSKSLMCCDPLISASGSCGDTKSEQKMVFFRSPSFPRYAGGDLVCDFKVRIRNDTLAIRVDFLTAEMDGLSFDGGGENTAHCESDMIFIRGFNTWAPPARCGNLTGYGVLVDTDSKQTRHLGLLSVVALMSSPNYRFNIRIVQITKNSDVKSFSKETIAKRSVYPYNVYPSISPTPTRILIKTVNPSQFSSATYADTSSFIADHRRESFKIFDSLYPTNWKSPSIVNGEDTVISTVPWQVSLRVIPPIMVPPIMTDFTDIHSSTETSSLESSFDSSSVSTAEDESTMESYTDSYPYPNCSEAEGIHFCGGSILDQRHVLSAAHCFFGSSKLDGMLNISSIIVVVGDTNKCTEDEEMGIFPEQEHLKSFRYGVESIIFHYGYDHSILINDVAILRLNESIKYFKHIKPIKLARQGDNFEGHEAMLSGWGDRFTEGNTNNYSIEEPGGPSILQSSKLLQIQNRSFCNERDLSQYGAPRELIVSHGKYTYAFDSTICTVTRNGSKVEVNTGRGDSGGPLISYYDSKSNSYYDSKVRKNYDGKNKSKEPILVGVVSYSIPFDEKVDMYDGVNRTVDFYTSVAFYRNWIDLAIKSLEQIVKNVI